MKKITVPKSYGYPETKVWANGVEYTIPTGVEVEVEDAVAEVLQTSMDYYANHKPTGGSGSGVSWNDLTDKPFWEEMTTSELFSETMVLEDGYDTITINGYSNWEFLSAKMSDIYGNAPLDDDGYVRGLTLNINGVEYAECYIGAYASGSGLSVTTNDYRYMFIVSTAVEKVQLRLPEEDWNTRNHDVKLYYTENTYHFDEKLLDALYEALGI